MSQNVRVRDFLRSRDNLFFAVVTDLVDAGRYLCNLRYAKTGSGQVLKFNTVSANRYLRDHYPHYCYYSDKLDVQLHGVRRSDVRQVLRPADSVHALLAAEQTDHKRSRARLLIAQLEKRGVDPERLGITGSVMLGFHGPASDIDFVVYGLNEFSGLRDAVRDLIGESPEYQLDSAMWMESFRRRDCELDFENYKKHELRKFNKLNWHGTKVDFSCIQDPSDYPSIRYPVRKLPACSIQARITDDANVFSFPARYVTDHADIREILCYTATYTGQAFRNEFIEARGPVEIDRAGIRRMVIGTSREAKAEYIKLLN